VRKLALDASDLVSGDQRIERSNIRLAQESSLPANIPTNILITLTGLVRPGLYEGFVTLRAADELPSKGEKIKLRITLRQKPTLLFVPPLPTWNTFSCDLAASCWLGEILTGESRTKSVGVDNQTQASVTVRQTSLELRGDITGSILTGSDLALEPRSLTLDPNKMGTIEARILERALKPDKYQGPLRVTVVDLEKPAATTITMTVRHGPLMALVLLIIGIFVGRLSQVVNSAQFQAQERRLEVLRVLQEAAGSIRRSDSRFLLRREIDDINLKMRLSQSSSEVDDALKKLSMKIELLAQVDALQGEAEKLAEPNVGQKAQQLERAAVKAVSVGKLEEAQNFIKEIEGLVSEAAAGSEYFFATPIPVLPLMLQATPVAVPRKGLEQLLLVLSGVQPVDASFAIWRIVKPALYLILLISLVLIGLYTLYVKNSTFGSDLLFDYVGVFIWGVSADIAQRTLQNLPRLG
jgi:hypothetical protein